MIWKYFLWFLIQSYIHVQHNMLVCNKNRNCQLKMYILDLSWILHLFLSHLLHSLNFFQGLVGRFSTDGTNTKLWCILYLIGIIILVHFCVFNKICYMLVFELSCLIHAMYKHSSVTWCLDFQYGTAVSLV